MRLPKDPVGGGLELIHEYIAYASPNHFYADDISGAGDVDGDGVPDFIIGEWGANSSRGAVYVHSGATGDLIHQVDGQNYRDQLGWDVSGAGDVDADGYADFAFNYPGLEAVQVYSGATGTLLHQFPGFSVSDGGDIDGDGFDDIIVGDGAASPGGLHLAGSVFVYSGAGGNLVHQMNGLNQNDHLGSVVRSAGDVNGDGFPDILASASGSSASGHFRSGSVYVYSGMDGTMLHQYHGTSDQENFGYSISAAGDVDNDGFDDIIIGSPDAYGADWWGGAAFVYSGQTGELIHRLTGKHWWHPWGFHMSGYTGWSVAGVGDVNRDGHDDLLVGSPAAIPNEVDGAGSVALYSGATGKCLQRWVGSVRDEHFGEGVAYLGDVNQDGRADLLTAAVGWDGGWFYTQSTVQVLSFEPYLTADRYQLSSATGGSIQLDINFPDVAAFAQYKVLISATGTGPMHYGVDIPLALDEWVIRTATGSYPFPGHNNMHGTLDHDGRAAANLNFAPGQTSALIGRTFWMAAVAHPFAQPPEFSSVAVPIQITL